jgi:pimeloyl-ACP methyl ester carboxylesterase
MADRASNVFLPGFAARPHTYAEGLPPGWEALQPPSPGVTRGSLSSLREWAVREVGERPGRAIVAGHSMGAALAVLVAVALPESVGGLILVAPAGLPLTKPIRRSARDAVRQFASGTHRASDVLSGARELAAAPRSALRLVRALRGLDLSAQMERVNALGIPTTIVGCTTDTLVTPQHCRRAAALLGADYRELALPGGHVWMLDRPRILASLLRDSADRSRE